VASTLEQELTQLVRQAVAESRLTPGGAPSAIDLELPKDRTLGDIATTVALKLSRQAKRSPLELARVIAEQMQGLLPRSPLAGTLDRIEVKPPGFINVFLSKAALHDVVKKREGRP